MIPSPNEDPSLSLLTISEKPVSKSKNHRRKQNDPKPLSHFLRPVSEHDEKKRNEITKFVACELVGAETYTCPNYRPHKDAVIFRKQGESHTEWRIRQRDILSFIHEDWFGDTTRQHESYKRGASAAFGVVSKAKKRGTLLLELRAALARRKAMWEAHQKRCGCRQKTEASEEAEESGSREDDTKDKETSKEEDQGMEIE